MSKSVLHIRAIDVLKFIPGIVAEDIKIYSRGRQGVYGLFGAAIDERVSGIDIKGGMESYSKWIRSKYYDTHDIMSVVLPGMIEYFDLPDLKRWFPETTLTKV